MKRGLPNNQNIYTNPPLGAGDTIHLAEITAGDTMCYQVDNLWPECTHYSYERIVRCPKFLNGCKGPTSDHHIEIQPGKCPDCVTRGEMPAPLDMSKDNKIAKKK